MERVFVFTVWESGEATDYATVLPPEVFSKAGAAGEEALAKKSGALLALMGVRR